MYARVHSFRFSVFYVLVYRVSRNGKHKESSVDTGDPIRDTGRLLQPFTSFDQFEPYNHLDFYLTMM